MEMKIQYDCSLAVVMLLSLALACVATDDFDFFYHVQQWPVSYCDTTLGCCFPNNQKPAEDFGIHGLWPNYAACRTVDNETMCWPDSCNPGDTLDTSLISDLESEMLRNWGTLSCKNKDNATAFWSHEWSRHGTCSGMDQRAYFLATLDFKARFNLTHILADAGITPSNERTYCLSSIRDALREATGSAPNLECNLNLRNETQLYQVYQCVGIDGRSPVPCPVPMDGGCTEMIKFPAFYDTESKVMR